MTTDRTTATDDVFAAHLARWEAADYAEESTVERIARAIFGFMPPIGYNLRLALARDAAAAAIAALRGPSPAAETTGAAK
jgi:hypothetical protein